MQVSVETTKGLGRKMTVEIPAEQVDNEVNSRLKDLAGRAKIDGFRPGKIPAKIVQQRYGQQVRGEVIGDLIKSTVYDAIKDHKLQIAGIPSIEPTQMDIGQPIQYTATFEVLPEIDIKSLSDVTVERIQSTLTDQDINDTLEKLRKQHAEWHEVSRAAQKGDQVIMDFIGSIDGKEFAGGRAENFTLELGAGSMIPGFEDQLMGTAKGDRVTVNVTFPEDYHHADVAGKAAEFIVTVFTVNEAKLPELDDVFAAKFNIKEGGIDALRKDLNENMQRELEQQIGSINKEQLFTKFLELNQFEIPTALVDEEIQRLQRQMMQRISGGKKFDLHKFPEMPRDIFEDKAKQRVGLGLLISQFIEKNAIKVEESRIDAYLQKMAKAYEKADELIAWVRGNEQQMAEIEAVVLEEIVVDRLYEQAKVIDKSTSYEEAMNPKTKDAVK